MRWRHDRGAEVAAADFVGVIDEGVKQREGGGLEEEDNDEGGTGPPGRAGPSFPSLGPAPISCYHRVDFVNFGPNSSHFETVPKMTQILLGSGWAGLRAGPGHEHPRYICKDKRL
ncbi:hypothetical protein PIB30_025370 [Stylosanthes scabra]|uniref:Uncharacterized protein n=1 Tax=Stylosanthes scabra TaxID=79078 RepID=A0ABU6Z9J9_9FABA|nr:hypothetical protein [Stylosanthes scabra]